jgi:hypothetical protein
MLILSFNSKLPLVVFGLQYFHINQLLDLIVVAKFWLQFWTFWTFSPNFTYLNPKNYHHLSSNPFKSHTLVLMNQNNYFKSCTTRIQKQRKKKHTHTHTHTHTNLNINMMFSKFSWVWSPNGNLYFKAFCSLGFPFELTCLELQIYTQILLTNLIPTST